MPPRYAYWTIIVDDQPTAFRAGAQEDLMPTFKRLQQKHPSAKMMWFQNGKLWPSRIDAQEAMRARGEMGRRGDERQGGFRDRTPSPRERFRDARPPAPSKHIAAGFSRPGRAPQEKLDWRAKGEFTPAPPSTRERFRDAKPSARSGQRKPAWTPKGGQAGPSKPEWKPKGPSKPDPSTRERSRDSKPFARSGQGKLEWTPKSSSPQAPKPSGSEKRKWVPKEEYKKSLGIEAKRDKNWRPGGEHKDPRQKYKDAKKAKWTRFKQTVRKRWEGKQGKKSGK